MYTSTTQAFQRIVAEEGILGLWTPGMLASALRELTYSSIRMGAFALATVPSHSLTVYVCVCMCVCVCVCE